MRHINKVLLHVTITGYGGTEIEPNVFTKEKSFAQISKLINLGFPAQQIVLRVDPIIPSDKGIATAKKVLELFSETGIKRVRYLFLDVYPHVAKRFEKKGIKLPSTTFNAPEALQSKARAEIHKYDSHYQFESCAEGEIDKLGCISAKDYKIMNIPFQIESTSLQRTGCSCVNKKELLSDCVRCSHCCLYCYWADEEK